MRASREYVELIHGACRRCGTVPADHDDGWRCPETTLFRWNRFKARLRKLVRGDR